MITRGLGTSLLITRGMGLLQAVVAVTRHIKREVLRLVSIINRTLELESS